MKNFLVKLKNLTLIVRAKTKLGAMAIVENEYSVAVYLDQVTKLKKKGIIYEVQT